MTGTVHNMPSTLVQPTPPSAADSADWDEDIAISCHENEVPEFVGPELERLYGNLFSSMMQFDISGLDYARTSTYVARDRNGPVALFLFQRTRGRVRVLNETIAIAEAEVQRFVRYIFATYRGVGAIAFNAVEVRRYRHRYPHQHVNLLEDIAMPLPATPQEYLAGLGKNTRRNIKRYGDRLLKAFPGHRFEICEREAVEEELIRQIIGFNHARMASKNKASNLDERSVRRVTRLARESGLVGVIRIDGRVCAGAISYRVGNNYFLDILAHDPAYDDYWIGILCCYRTICECILHGGREFHFLWGRYDYKFTLGAKLRELDALAVYRSRAHMLLHAGFALRLAYDGRLRQLKLWMESDESQRSGTLSQWAFRCMLRARTFKRAAATLLGR